MSKFRKGKKTVGAVSTASLPDIVFMLLFFFMVTTVMRETEQLVENSLPSASETVKLKERSLVGNIYVGVPLKKKIHGSEPRIQLDDRIVPSALLIRDFVQRKKDKVAENDHGKMIWAIKADKEIKMGVIAKVKNELREVNALKISYGAKKVERNDK